MEKVKEIILAISWLHIGGVLVLYGLYAFLLQDRSLVDEKAGIVGDMQTRVQRLEKEIQEAEEFERQLNDRKKQLEALNEQLRSKKAELPTSFNVPELLRDIFSEAEQVGLEITNVQPATNPETAELFESMRVELAAKGTYLQFFIFLDRLSKLKRLVGVTNFNLKPDGGRPDGISLRGTTGALSKQQFKQGEDRRFKAVTGSISLLAYRIK